MIKGPSGCGEDGREGFGGGNVHDAGDRGLGGFGYRWSDTDDRWGRWWLVFTEVFTVTIVEADCKNKTCSHSGKIFKLLYI